MTMKGKIAIFEQGLEEHPKATIILGNLVMMLWIALGTIACWFLHPLLGWLYLAAALIMVGVVLRKLVCTNCYYYGKWCGTGWGKLSALFFKKGEMEKFSTSIGVKLAPLTYGLLSLIPIVLIVISIIKEFTVFKIIVLALLLLVSVYSGFLSRKKGCANCKMKLACPGSVS
ncbi:MAG: hypothetical protein HQ588_03820 [Deltaproteobacteria bacterium]|nr:hypothetical protein [Deltaproteobacteria bacterium]